MSRKMSLSSQSRECCLQKYKPAVSAFLVDRKVAFEERIETYHGERFLVLLRVLSLKQISSEGIISTPFEEGCKTILCRKAHEEKKLTSSIVLLL